MQENLDAAQVAGDSRQGASDAIQLLSSLLVVDAASFHAGEFDVAAKVREPAATHDDVVFVSIKDGQPVANFAWLNG
jgi:hypothetical protein